MKNLRRLLTVVILGASMSAVAQQDAHFTQYMDNTLFINSAYAGSAGVMNATAIHREQWVGFEGRPRSTTFSLHSPLPYESVALGFTAVNDIVGPIQSTAFYGDFAYRLFFKNSKAKLSFGIKGGINILNSRQDELFTLEGQDPNLISPIRNQVLPNFGAGIYFHHPRFFIGLSTPKILQQNIGNVGSTSLEKRHFFAIAGAVIDLDKRDQWKLRPTTHFKLTEGAPLSIDLSLAAIYRSKLYLGLMHRVGDSFGGFVQYQITDQFKAGIAYDYTLTRLADYNSGTYEVLLSYDFSFNKKGIRSPRYF